MHIKMWEPSLLGLVGEQETKGKILTPDLLMTYNCKRRQTVKTEGCEDGRGRSHQW
jgi:hypothetical protein